MTAQRLNLDIVAVVAVFGKVYIAGCVTVTFITANQVNVLFVICVCRRH